MQRRMLPFMLLVTVIVVGSYGFTACRDAKGDVGPVALAIFAQQGDSVGLVLAWSPATVGPRQRPIASYDTRVIGTQAGDTLASGNVPVPPDTMWVGAPLAGDTLYVRGCVRTVDDRAPTPGRSTWRCSIDHAFEMPYLPPSPPDSVFTDTVPPIELTALHVRPQNVIVAQGDSVQFCAIGEFSDGTSVIFDYAELGPWAQSECDVQYALWQSERSAQLSPDYHWATQNGWMALMARGEVVGQ